MGGDAEALLTVLAGYIIYGIDNRWGDGQGGDPGPVDNLTSREGIDIMATVDRKDVESIQGPGVLIILRFPIIMGLYILA